MIYYRNSIPKPIRQTCVRLLHTAARLPFLSFLFPSHFVLFVLFVLSAPCMVCFRPMRCLPASVSHIHSRRLPRNPSFILFIRRSSCFFFYRFACSFRSAMKPDMLSLCPDRLLLLSLPSCFWKRYAFKVPLNKAFFIQYKNRFLPCIALIFRGNTNDCVIPAYTLSESAFR